MEDDPIRRFLPGDGSPTRQIAGSTTHSLFDPQGNVAQRLDPSQTILNSSLFDAYGVESATSSPSDPFGFNAQSGYLLDRDTGLYLCEHRYYDVATGRWVTRDPIGYSGGLNLYGYTGGNPVGRKEADGMSPDPYNDFARQMQQAFGIRTPEALWRNMDSAAMAYYGYLPVSSSMPREIDWVPLGPHSSETRSHLRSP